MRLIKQKMIYREDLKANPEILYIFGDNLDRDGYGGQAFHMRGEHNAFGIATKRSISHNYPLDYFFDEHSDVIPILKQEFQRLWDHIAQEGYDTVIVPLDGIGTGLSKMPEYAPKALEFINEQIEHLTRL